jgi:8-oxo-dGTP pyrophosphatase MutT (NUDIX family)
MKGRDPHKAAAREAWEEAGVRGKALPAPMGVYHYNKDRGNEGVVPCAVQVFALAVDRVTKSWPEEGQRRRKWFAPSEAANRVEEPELRAILARFSPDSLPC